MRWYCGGMNSSQVASELFDVDSQTTSKHEFVNQIIDLRSMDTFFSLRVCCLLHETTIGRP